MKAPDTLSEAEVRAVKEREGERILAHVKSEAHVVALTGRPALEFRGAGSRDRQARHVWDEPCRVVIGGSHGLSDEVLPREAATELRAHDPAASVNAAGAGGADLSRGEDQSERTVP